MKKQHYRFLKSDQISNFLSKNTFSCFLHLIMLFF
jgi:hypothetical protein